jgi:RNA polymerase sigma-70 factor (ECF subfamily)
MITQEPRTCPPPLTRRSPRPSDDALVAAFRSGRDEAFATIVARHRPCLLDDAHRLVRGTGLDAEDVVQDALIKAYKALGRGRGPMALRAWLRRIVRNCAIDHRRGLRDVPSRAAVGASASAAEAAASRSKLAEVMRAIEQLPERQRHALVLHAFGGYDYRWIARELDASLPATKALLARARSNLRPPAQPVV